MKPITEQHELFQIEMWLVELKAMLECEALIATPDVAPIYAARAQEITNYLQRRDEK